MTFTSNGTLSAVNNYTEASPATSPRTWNLSATANAQPQINIGLASLNGSAASTFSLSFLNSMQQNTGTSGVVAINQNGYAPGSLVSYAINDDGTVVGSYSNEQSQLLGQIVLANFANNEACSLRVTTFGLLPTPLVLRCSAPPAPVTSAS